MTYHQAFCFVIFLQMLPGILASEWDRTFAAIAALIHYAATSDEPGWQEWLADIDDSLEEA